MPISVKWLNVITKRDKQDVEGLEREIEDALFCPECLPSCVDTQYQMTLVTLPMDRYLTSPTNNSRYKTNSILNFLTNCYHSLLFSISSLRRNDTQSGDSNDVSLVRVFFALPSARLHRYIIQNNWGAIFSEYFLSLSRVVELRNRQIGNYLLYKIWQVMICFAL